MSIEKLLNKERELHRLLNMKDCPVDINEQFTALFNDPLMLNSTAWFNNIFKCETAGMHDEVIVSFSQKKQINDYRVSFYVNFRLDGEFYGTEYFKNAHFSIVTKDDMRAISNKTILDCRIDPENKQISFYYYNGGRHKDNVLTCSYNEISVDPGIRCSYDYTSSSFGL